MSISEQEAVALEARRILDRDEDIVYVPVVSHDGMVGYRCHHNDGEVEYLYFNPSNTTDGTVPNVFVYQGAHFDVARDIPVSPHHLVFEWRYADDEIRQPPPVGEAAV